MKDYEAPSRQEAEELNQQIRYLSYSVFRVADDLGDLNREDLAKELTEAISQVDNVVVRGIYDVSVFRADADIMFWYHAPTVEDLQKVYAAIRTSALGSVLEPVWSVVGIHRPAEFNRSHVPAFLTDDDPGEYLCVYPFVRSYEWYLLEPRERGKMLHDHGKAAAGYKDIKANTVSGFALGDYEWLLAFEAQHLERIVDLMRDLRNTEARMHVRKEIPFFTGPRKELVDIISGWR
ncbi:chlorite dismutase family protein [Brevibacterium sp. UMB1308A]|uniref:hydrogen peroxide-dependent heme synthase n=1 Tax=Brevibacterium sp. UMB1308A TaxID=3050608 RepID=UPI00254AE4B0|nr:hydrogen peroxide-dependent heme synthase [Brevibacterium sp. UMB1308A]MDK8346395.1 chlorite dismutase family protein [Brevibacterium sp. UMB1308B]MDK8713354.1 chlorite dismutase family protein [Brevibacterium sp. UMB1308A]